MAHGQVKHIKNDIEYDAELTGAADKLVVVDFFAQWCGPCKRIAPFIEQLSTDLNGKVVFLKVDVDEVPNLAAREQISAMPTFYFYKGKKKIADLVGASQDRLKDIIEKMLKT